MLASYSSSYLVVEFNVIFLQKVKMALIAFKYAFIFPNASCKYFPTWLLKTLLYSCYKYITNNRIMHRWRLESPLGLFELGRPLSIQ